MSEGAERVLGQPWQWGDEEVMTALRAQARLVAREEIASLCALVLRRLQDDHKEVENRMAGAFAEALNDFGGTTYEPGT